MRVDERRVRVRREGEVVHGRPVVYFMSREMRMKDNWALLYAQHLALQAEAPLAVVYNLVPNYLGGGRRHWDFKVGGLLELQDALAKKNIPLFVTVEEGVEEVARFCDEHHVGAVVADFTPLRIAQKWMHSLGRHLDVPLYEVDAHNIVPCWLASPKKEWAAATFRPKIHALLPEFLTEIPSVKMHPYHFRGHVPALLAERLERGVVLHDDVPPITWAKPGEKAAARALERFVGGSLHGYDEARNDPTKDGQSNLSPYFHYGMIAPQRVALAVKQSGAPRNDVAAYLEEMIVRRELSDNFCFYEINYDNEAGFPDWAKATLEKHARDERAYTYTRAQFERAQTHDAAWNAAQREMVETGKMHGYMRMYWAKKILEWTSLPKEAMKIAIYLNDKYEIDGRDPNGYVGIAWSIGGVHDRAWGERPVYGTVRSMVYAGLKRKFAIDEYVARWCGDDAVAQLRLLR